MSIAKKILASIVAVSTIVSSFVTMTAFAANHTIKGKLLTSDYLFGEEGPFWTATAGSGVEISVEGLEKNVHYLDFEIKIPKDLKVEVTEGSGKKQTHPLRDITATNITEAIVFPEFIKNNISIVDRSTENFDFYTYYFQYINNTAEGWDGSSSIVMYFGSTDEEKAEEYNVKAGSFDIENVQFGYLNDTEYTPVTVVQATSSDEPVVDDGTADRVSDSKGNNHWYDGNNDHSVAFSKVFTNTAAKVYTLEAVVGDKTYTHPTEIKIPNVDANVEYKVGIIIQYNPNAAENAIDFNKITSLKFVEIN